jgi:hypothetical protein
MDFHSPRRDVSLHSFVMKFFLLRLLTFVVLVAVVGGGGALFYLAKTSEITRATATPPASTPGN